MSRDGTGRMALLSSLALGGAAVVLAIALWGALHVAPPTADAPPTRRLATSSGAIALPEGVDTSVRRVALASDPFSADRSLPDAEVADASDAPNPTATSDSTRAVRLLGTVVRGNGGFAVCQIATDAPRIVHVGERIGTLTLTTLMQGRVAFRSTTGARVELTLSKPET